MINEEIARLTGTLKWNVDNRPLLAFQNRLAKVHQSLSEFSALANKKFGIKVTLDAKSLRAQLERAANTKISFKNFHVDNMALDLVQARIKDSLDRTRINLRNVKVNMSETLAQRAALRKQLEGVSVGIRVAMRFQEANTALREWKKTTEQRFKLYINADISQSKLYRNAARTLRAVGARLGTFTIKSPKVQLTVDRQHLRAEIASVLEQIKREVRIKIDLSSMTRGSGGGGARRSGGGMGRAVGGGMAGGLASEGMGLARGFVPGLGAAYAVGQMNRISQQVTAVGTSLKAVSGSNEEFTSNMDFLSKIADEQGRNIRDIGPEFVSVLASAKASIGSKGTQDLFRGVMKYGTVMGLDGEAMKGSFRAISQMFSKDKIQAEEAQGQLAERLPAAMQLLAQANNTDVPGLRKQMQAGQLDPKKVLPEMAKIMEKLAMDNGAYAAALETTRVQQGRMNREFEKSVVIFGAAGFDSGLASFFKTVTEGLRTNEPLVKSLGQAFKILILPLNSMVELIARMGRGFDDFAASLGIPSKALALLPALLFPVASAFAFLLLTVDDFFGYMDGKDSSFGRWIKDTPGAKAAIDGVREAWEQLSTTLQQLFSGDSKVSIDTGVLSSERLKNNFAAINFSDMFVQTLKEVKAVMEFVNATIERMTGAAAYARRITRPDGGDIETSMNLLKGLSMNDVERKADVEKQVKQGYVLPLGPDDIQARNDAQARRTQVLPGINTPLSNDPNRAGVGSVPSSQAPVISNTWAPGAVQIIIQPEKEGLFTEEGIANKAADVLRNLLNQHEIPQDTE